MSGTRVETPNRRLDRDVRETDLKPRKKAFDAPRVLVEK